MRPKFPGVHSVAIELATPLFLSAAVMSTDVRATAAVSDLPPLTVAQLMPTLSSGSTIQAVDLDNANRTLVNVSDGPGVNAYIASGTSSIQVADYRPIGDSEFLSKGGDCRGRCHTSVCLLLGR
jgi:hypothetical protein